MYWAVWLSVVITSTWGWSLYEDPLEILAPNSNGIYEMDMILEHKISMTRKVGSGEVQVVDFDPLSAEWTLRNSDLKTECNQSRPFVSNSASEMRYLEELDSLIQYAGRHIKVVTINGKSPGPQIAVPHGAEVILRIINRLGSEAVTLHLHGVDKRHLWYTDGVAFVQQCPVAAGSTHTYRFIADTPGTHWYHGHLMNDRADGLLGAFAILPRDRSTPTTSGNRIMTKREYFMILQDWATLPSEEQWFCHVHQTMKWVGYGFDDEAKNKCWAPRRTFDASNVGGSIPLSAIVVNSKGWHSQDDMLNRPHSLPLTTYRISRNEDQRFRLVNGGVSQGIIVWAPEDHSITVVAADGVEVKPTPVDGVIIFPGERYDIHIRGLSSPSKMDYYFVLETMEYFNWDWSVGQPQYGLAKLHYDDVKFGPNNSTVDFGHSKCTAENKCLLLNCPFEEFPPTINYKCLSAHKLQNNEPLIDGEILEQKMFRENFREIFANMHFDNHMDGYMFKSPRGIPYYHSERMDEIATKCDPWRCDRFNGAHWNHSCDCFYHYEFAIGEIVQMTIYNMGDGGTYGTGYSHPLHLHGTHFHVMKIGYPLYHENNMTIRSMNPDIPCFDTTKRCVDLRWSDPSWARGNVHGMEQNPSYRDTINLPTGGYVTIRFRATNPGWWYAHCHLMLHHMGGTAFAFRIGSHDEIPRPPSNYPHSCGIYNPTIYDNSASSSFPIQWIVAIISLILLLL